mgnify:CR=1 FL=1
MNSIKTVGSINEGNEYLFISETFKESDKSVLYIARNDKEIFKIRKKLEWVLPQINIQVFRSWDQIPYDNVSPSKEIQSERINCLYQIINNNSPKIIITSVNAIIQKTISRDFINNYFIKISRGNKLDFNNFLKKLNFLGYERVSLVREKSEFAVRGSIIDIFISNITNPIRIDFNNDEIENVNEFDKITQKKIKKINSDILIGPSCEILLNNNTINLFRKNFRKIFLDYRLSKIYNIFSESIIPNGGENYFTLFYKSTSSIFDYCKNFNVIINSEFDKLLETRLENINDYYLARIDNGEKFILDNSFSYLDNQIINNYFKQINLIKLNEFKIEKESNFKIKKVPNLSSIKKEIDFEFIRKFLEYNSKKNIIICCRSRGSKERLKEITYKNLSIKSKDIDNYDQINEINIYITILEIEESVEFENYIYLNEKSLLGYNLLTTKNTNRNRELFFEEINKFTTNCILVHSDYGFCKFIDINKIDLNNSQHDCVKLEFANNQKLLLPIENINIVTKYSEDSKNIKLDHLGNANWQKRKANAKNKIKDIAKKMMSIAAKRHNSSSYKINFNQSLYEKFSNTFQYVETDDQLKVIEDVKNDFLSKVPADRLIVGDVAFGKTEIIIRATFLAATSKIQSLVLVPTTLLSRQHYINFSQRLNAFGIEVRELSRFIKPSEKKKIYFDIENGKADVIIGTHSLLNDKINFKKLGLIIYDEEQKLGTQQKEKLKSKSPRAHVISLSATPIPRTLSLSLSGIRDLSLILTPPYERLSIRTYISVFDKITIKEAIKREIYGRKNSVFYVTPRRKDIPFIENFIKEYLPEVKYVIAHGKLKPEILEERILKFYNKEIPLLISTNIIENGLDFPHVNTIIINRSNIFSLSSLYQLKGRVGRSVKRGYAYLTYLEKDITENARKRLNIINSFEDIGSGFNIASQDLNLRGGGSIIGEEQSGFIKDVGVELYHQMLEDEINLQKIKILKKEETIKKTDFEPTIRIPEKIYIPDNYINDLDVKMSMYKRISLITNDKEKDNLIVELIDRFGKLPLEVNNLFKLIQIKIMCIKFNIELIDFGRKGILFSFYKNLPLNREKILKLAMSNKKFIIRNDLRLFFDFNGVLEDNRFELIKKIINKIN